MKVRHVVLFGFGKAQSPAAIAEVIRRFAELKALGSFYLFDPTSTGQHRSWPTIQIDDGASQAPRAATKSISFSSADPMASQISRRALSRGHHSPCRRRANGRIELP
jgi:hypothetical protein